MDLDNIMKRVGCFQKHEVKLGGGCSWLELRRSRMGCLTKILKLRKNT